MPKALSTPRAVSSFTAREIAFLLKRSRSVFTNPELSIKISPREGLFSKILIITPKKMGNAPLRNLIKRRLKSAFYEERLYEGPFHVIVYCRKNADKIPYQDLKNTLLATVAQPK